MGNIKTHYAFDIYTIDESDGNVFITNRRHDIIPIDEIKEIALALSKFADSVDSEEYRRIYNSTPIAFSTFGENEGKTMCEKQRYIYLMECCGKYKVGCSDNVERRKQQLDKRPFDVVILEKSRLIDNPFKQEQRIHEMLNEYRIKGEWYELPDYAIEMVKDIIRKL